MVVDVGAQLQVAGNFYRSHEKQADAALVGNQIVLRGVYRK